MGFGEDEGRSKADGFVAAVAGGRRRGRERNNEDGWRGGRRMRGGPRERERERNENEMEGRI